MDDAVERARGRRNAVAELAARVPGFRGYAERELRREVDALLRRRVAEVLDDARRNVAGVLRRLPLTAAGRVDTLSRLEKALDAAGTAVRHAGSGYAGLFDAFPVGEPELETLYAFDLGLLDEAQRLRDFAAAAADDEAALAGLEAGIEAVRASLAERPQVIRAAFAVEEAP